MAVPTLVDVWYVLTAEAVEQDLCAAYREWLTPEELARDRRYRVADAQLQHLVARVLVRSVLAAYTGVAAAALRFTVGPYGKPAVLGLSTGLSFNLSHTSGAVVCAVASGGQLGVDIERQDRVVELELAQRYFAADEVVQLQAAEPPLQARRFLEFWTLKESFIKALGTGLATPLSSFAFDLDSPRPHLRYCDYAAGAPADWSFAPFELEGQFLGAVALRSDERNDVELTMRRCLPLRY